MAFQGRQQRMLTRRATLLGTMGLTMVLSMPALAGHLGPENRGGQDPQGDDKGQGRGWGQVTDSDNAAEDAGRGNGSEGGPHPDADPGNSKDVNQGGD